MTLQGTNTYVIGKGSHRILLDSGEAENQEYLDSLKLVLEKEKASLSHIILTHHHIDHVGGVPSILETLKIKDKCSVFKYLRDEDVAMEPSNALEMKPIKDGDEFHAEGATLKMYFTPGHSDDHMSALLLEERALFSGDCILGEGTAVFENLRQLMQSLAFFLELDPNVIYPGHGPVVENPVEKITQYIQHRLQREQQILQQIPMDVERAVSIHEIVRKIYVNVPEKLMKAAAINVFHHLTKLEEEDIVRSIETTEGKLFVRV